MRILIDGDGCPVIDECIKISNKFKIESAYNKVIKRKGSCDIKRC